MSASTEPRRDACLASERGARERERRAEMRRMPCLLDLLIALHSPAPPPRLAARAAAKAARELRALATAGPDGAQPMSWARALQVFSSDEKPANDEDDFFYEDDDDWFVPPPEGNDDDDGNDEPPPPPPPAGHAIAV